MDRALKLVQKNDMERGERMRQLYDVDWTTPHLYDLVLNTEKISVEAGAQLIVQLVQGPPFRATEASNKKLHNLAVVSAIRAELKAHRPTQKAEVDIQVADGKITLTGVVASEAEKRAVERVVAGIKGLEGVESQLRVLGYRGRRVT